MTDPNADPSPPESGAAAPPAPAAAVPFAHDELRACLRHHLRTLDVVLAERRRLVANVHTATALTSLLAVLILCSIVFTTPFAAVDGFRRSMHVATLFLGSVLLCFPSLQVFGAYLGLRLSPAQNLAVALLIPSSAAMFTLGFFPIYWFLAATMPAGSPVDGVVMRIALLVFAMLLALSHANRCLFVDSALQAFRVNRTLWVGWQLLLVFITYRMATTLGMFG